MKQTRQRQQKARTNKIKSRLERKQEGRENLDA
jgi:hypothetical protein